MRNILKHVCIYIHIYIYIELYLEAQLQGSSKLWAGLWQGNQAGMDGICCHVPASSESHSVCPVDEPCTGGMHVPERKAGTSHHFTLTEYAQHQCLQQHVFHTNAERRCHGCLCPAATAATRGLASCILFRSCPEASRLYLPQEPLHARIPEGLPAGPPVAAHVVHSCLFGSPQGSHPQVQVWPLRYSKFQRDRRNSTVPGCISAWCENSDPMTCCTRACRSC